MYWYSYSEKSLNSTHKLKILIVGCYKDRVFIQLQSVQI